MNAAIAGLLLYIIIVEYLVLFMSYVFLLCVNVVRCSLRGLFPLNRGVNVIMLQAGLGEEMHPPLM